MAKVKTMHFDGPCPFLLCLEEGPHDHPICPDCGAVRCGNIFCPTCRRLWLDVGPELQQAIKEALYGELGQHEQGS